jgi:bromodomain-containing factor 1
LLVPRYYAVIKNPMDLQTISDNMKDGIYGERLATLLVDIRKIFKNCYQFNLKDSAIYQHAERLEHYFERELLPEAVPEMAAVLPVAPLISPATSEAKSSATEKIVVKKEVVKRESVPEIEYQPIEIHSTSTVETVAVLSNADSHSCRRILNKMVNNESSFWFHAPVSFDFNIKVDPVALGIPHYFDVIKNPMDFGTINNKLNNSLYCQVQEFISDVELVFNNALTFNPPDSPVVRAAKTLLNYFEKNFSKAKLKEIKIKLETPNDPNSNISRILSKLKEHPDCSIFLFPVDPIVVICLFIIF